MVVLLALAAFSALPAPGPFAVVLAAVLAVNLVSATQDIATDGLAVDLLPPSERGLANGLQVAGYRVGMILGGGALLVLFERLGSARSFAVMAVSIALASVPVLLLREPASPRAEPGPGGRPGVLAFVRRPGTGPILALLAAYKTGDAFATAMLKPFLVDLGLGMADVGWLVGTVGFVAGLLGALAGGAWVNGLGRRRALLVFGALQALAVGGYAAAAWWTPSTLVLYALCALEHLAGGMATAALFTCMMDWCARGSSATDYTVQASVVVWATGLASLVAGYSAQALGYVGHFSLATAGAALSLLAVVVLFPAEGPA